MFLRSSFRRPLVIALLMLLLAAPVLWYIFAKQKDNAVDRPRLPPSGNATPVVVGTASPATDDIALDIVGTALASTSVTLYPPVNGEVERVLFSAGDQVKKGQVLVQLVDRSEKLAVELAAAQRDAANRLLARYQRTQDSGAVAASVLDEARIALRRAETELAQAREQLRDRTIRAPFDGIVGIAQVEPGDRVTPATPLTTFDDRTSLSVAFQVPEPFLARLKTGQPVALSSVAFPGRKFSGKLTRIDSRLDPVTRVINVRAAVPNPEDVLRPGMSLAVRLTLPGAPVIQVPELSLQWSREGSHVWAIREEKSIQIPVRVIRRMGGSVLVDGELRDGEMVVIEGVQRLRPGRTVRILRSDSATRPLPVPAGAA